MDDEKEDGVGMSLGKFTPTTRIIIFLENCGCHRHSTLCLYIRLLSQRVDIEDPGSGLSSSNIHAR